MLGAKDTERAIVFYQPWASLIVEGLKSFETTRLPAEPWMIGNRLRIRASANPFPGVIDALIQRMMDRALRERGLALDDLPRGVVLGDVLLIGCYEAASEVVKGRIDLGQRIEGSPPRINGVSLDRRERKFGNFQPSRWIWQFGETHPLKTWEVGTVKWYSKRKGFGFITWGKTDVFILHKVKDAAGISLFEDQIVRFRAEKTSKGFRAVEIAEATN